MNNAITLKAVTVSNLFNWTADHRGSCWVPPMPSNRPVTTKMNKTTNPISQEPCEFTHNRNNGGSTNKESLPCNLYRHSTASNTIRHIQPNRRVRGPNETVARNMATQHPRNAGLQFPLTRQPR